MSDQVTYGDDSPGGWTALRSMPPLQMALASGGLVALLLVAGVAGFFLSGALSGDDCEVRLQTARTELDAKTKALASEISVLKAAVAEKSEALKREGEAAKKARDRMEELRAAAVRAERELTEQRRKTQAFLAKLPEQCRQVEGAPQPLRPSNLPKARPGGEADRRAPGGEATGPKAKPSLRPKR